MSSLRHKSSYLAAGALAAIVYAIPVSFFVHDAAFRQAWLLYLGNFMFLLPVVFFLVWFNRRRQQNAGSVTMLGAGLLVTVIGVAFACLLGFILLNVFIPDMLAPGVPGKVLQGAPANMVEDKTNGLTFMVIANAIIGNTSMGAFISTIYAFSLKGDQTKEKAGKL